MRGKRAKLSRIGEIFADGRLIDEALRAAVQEAIRKHAAVGAPLAIWRDGAVAWVWAEGLLAQKSTKKAGRKPATTRRRRRAT